MKFGGRKLATFRGSARVPARRHLDGSMAQSPGEVADIVARHFADNECAAIGAHEDLVQWELARPQPDHIDILDISNIPSKSKTRAMIASNTAGKTPGPDGVLPEYVLASVPAAADILHPLYVKCALHRQEPLESKRATAVDLHKGGSQFDNMDYFRSVLLGSYITKTYHKFIRERTLTLVRHLLKSSQSGGVPGGSCELPVLTVRSFSEILKHKKIAGSIFFFDVRSAYYSGLRSLLTQDATDDDDAEEITRTTQAADRLILAMHEVLHRPGVLDLWAGNDPSKLHFKQMVAEAHAGSSFMVKGSALFSRPRKGMKPGDTLADLMISVTLAPILEDIAERLANLGVLYRPEPHTRVFLEADGHDHITDATFADDTAFMIMLNNIIQCTQATDTLSTAAGTIASAFASRGLQPNFKKGKSGAVLFPFGRGCQVFKRHCLLDKGGKIPVAGSDGDNLLIDVTYKHLGTMAASNMSMSVEVKQRKTRFQAAIGPLRKTLFARDITQTRKIIYTDSLAISLLVVHAGAWEALTASQETSLLTSQCSGYRAATGNTFRADKDSLITNGELLAKIHRVPVTVSIRLARL